MIYSLRRPTSLILLIVLVAGFALSTPRAAQAAMIHVNTTTDPAPTTPGVCSLRQAILSVNERKSFGNCPAGNGNGDMIVLAGSTYQLTITGVDDTGYKGDLDITKGVTIIGVGPSTRIEPGVGYKDRIFHIMATSPVVMEKLLISGGYVQGTLKGQDRGGAILNDQSSVLQLKSVTVENSKVLKVNTSDSKDLMGGGIFNESSAWLFISSSVFTGNQAKNGGGIYNSGRLTIEYSLLHNNTVEGTGAAGGALDNRPLQNTYPTYITNSTFSGNTGPEGAGIASWDNLIITHNTIADNKIGSALLVFANSTVTMRNTLLVDNFKNCSFLTSASVRSLGYNLVDKATDDCLLNGPGDQKGKARAAVLAPSLADNEGITKTYALVTGGTNPAISSIPRSNCILFDQRKKTRFENYCDIGAFEDSGGDVYYEVMLPVIVR
jgi:CSLREA domain-containing protein